MSAQVVDLFDVEPGIACIRMQDRASKNGLTAQLVDELREAFYRVSANEDYRVALLTGYDNYFCTGGTLEDLVHLHEGRGRFTDAGIYSVSLDCKIPVIAAIQGHAIGGGFILGLFADCVVLAIESVYTANFMKFGFTPGMGATCVLPKKLGIALGQEMLMSAATYRGADLKGRGIPFSVVRRVDVWSHACRLAQEMASKPRAALVTLKDHLVRDIREQLPGAIDQELAMHAKTFHEPGVRERINSLWGLSSNPV